VISTDNFIDPADRSNVFDPETCFVGKALTSDWASRNYPAWIEILAPLRLTPLSILEIGSWEGRSALFFLNYLSRSKIICIDTFEGSWEHQARPLEWRLSQLSQIEQRFDQNLAEFGDRVEKQKEDSLVALGRLGLARRRFELIYVDGSHRAVDVYRDAVLAWPLLAHGGILIFDDYIWDNGPPEERPNVAIDAFLGTISDRYTELARGHQVIIRKLPE
jgi:predicted O-methyltransferase YrrM